VNSIRIYDDVKRSAEVSLSMSGGNKGHKPEQRNRDKLKEAAPAQGKPAAAEGPPTTLTVFINPYSAQVLEAYNPREGFFYKVMALHRWLLGSNSGPGKYITGISTFIFLFILITGLTLWWPKSRAIVAQRIKLKWDGGWKRLNHDLHIVFGFYSFIFLFIFAFTALAWSFEWFNKGIYKVAGSSMKPPEPPKSVMKQGSEKAGLNTIYEAAKAENNNTVFMNIVLPKDSSSAVTVTSLSREAVHETATDALYFDQYSGAMLGHLYYGERNLGARIRAGFRPVHVGSIWGMPSKILAVIVCLFGASFPITGTIMWLNRTRKKKKPMVLKSEQIVS
ncbi:MAG TPA: PepSY-associated TM helix domain-containing protein, partial [Chitinophagaceae bacterium]|nr:PepSY-associated TM helix domain-containing protein [Chitinophagaceae bacterium]